MISTAFGLNNNPSGRGVDKTSIFNPTGFGTIGNPQLRDIDGRFFGTLRKYEKPENSSLNSSYTTGLTDVSGNLDYKRQLELLQLENAFNAREAQKSRDWQERMSNTAFQRATEDLRKSGFNPALILGASGASTPTGATARSSSKSGTSTSANATALMTAFINGAFKLASSVLGGILK